MLEHPEKPNASYKRENRQDSGVKRFKLPALQIPYVLTHKNLKHVRVNDARVNHEKRSQTINDASQNNSKRMNDDASPNNSKRINDATQKVTESDSSSEDLKHDMFINKTDDYLSKENMNQYESQAIGSLYKKRKRARKEENRNKGVQIDMKLEKTDSNIQKTDASIHRNAFNDALNIPEVSVPGISLESSRFSLCPNATSFSDPMTCKDLITKEIFQPTAKRDQASIKRSQNCGQTKTNSSELSVNSCQTQMKAHTHSPKFFPPNNNTESTNKPRTKITLPSVEALSSQRGGLFKSLVLNKPRDKSAASLLEYTWTCEICTNRRHRSKFMCWACNQPRSVDPATKSSDISTSCSEASRDVEDNSETDSKSFSSEESVQSNASDTSSRNNTSISCESLGESFRSADYEKSVSINRDTVDNCINLDQHSGANLKPELDEAHPLAHQPRFRLLASCKIIHPEFPYPEENSR
ncbi:hypothetical protein WDU94_011056 [Cyamophila willieti]